MTLACVRSDAIHGRDLQDPGVPMRRDPPLRYVPANVETVADAIGVQRSNSLLSIQAHFRSRAKR